MQARKLPATAGIHWIRAGWRLFRKQPLGFTALLFTYWLLLLAASAIVGWIATSLGSPSSFVSADALAFVGGVLVAILMPALTVGFLQACRAVGQGLPAHPVLLFAPFRAGRETVQRLLVLGALQMIAIVVILLVTTGGDAFRADTGPAAQPPAVTATTVEAMTPAQQEAMLAEMATRVKQGLAYVPVALLMWYAPMLIAWHRLPVGKSMFFGVVALWRNRGAFAVYGVAWVVVWFAISVAITLLAIALHLANVVAFLTAPAVMVLLTWMYCSVYATYDTVFVEDVSPSTDVT